MKINDILECFNKALDSKGNPRGIHYVAHSALERKIGIVKSASTTITLYDPQAGPQEVVKKELTAAIPNSLEEDLVEETQRKALTEFIIKCQNDTGVE